MNNWKWKRKGNNYRIRVFYAQGIKQAELEKRVCFFLWVMVDHVYISEHVNTSIVYKWIHTHDIRQKNVHDATLKFEPSALLKELYNLYN